MKTIKELNKRWWWRVFKVIYFFIILLIFLVFFYDKISIGYQKIDNNYFPNQIEEFQEKINLYSYPDGKIRGLNNEEISLLEKYKDEGYTKEDFKEFLVQKRQRDLFDTSINSDIRRYIKGGYDNHYIINRLLESEKRKMYDKMSFREKIALIKVEILYFIFITIIVTLVLRSICFYIILGDFFPRTS